jgi:chain length determinant protein (polysaccharide antigen chain regulator)
MQGNSPEAMSTYLNSLVLMANSKTITALIKLKELKISNRIEKISLERDLLLEQAEKDRFSQIERIKEEDAQKIRQINDQIDRARYQAKENRLNQIVVLTDAAKLAKSLGIIEDNFKLIKGDGASSDLTIAIGDNKDLPEWYLYGEKALLQRVELLQSRTSDDPFIPELVTLNNQLNEVQNNNALKTLETRQDDSPFIAEIAKLDVEKIKLESRIVAMISVSAMQLSQVAFIPESPIKPNKRLIVLLAFIGSFMMSILLALIMGALKPEEKTPA